MFTGRALDAGFFYYALIPGMLLAALGMCTYPDPPLHQLLFTAPSQPSSVQSTQTKQPNSKTLY